MHIVWKGQFRFQIIVSPSKREHLKINIDESKILVGDFVIEGPGEYEIKDIFVQGLGRDYLIEAEEMRVGYLLEGRGIDEFGEIDILLAPADKAKLVSQIEPRIVIPMGEGINKFLKEMGKKSAETLPKLLVKKKDLPEEMKIVVLKT